MFYICTVSTEEDAKRIIQYAKEIATNYGRCSLVDMRDLCGDESKYEDRKINWTIEDLDQAKFNMSNFGCDIFLRDPEVIKDTADASKDIRILQIRGHWTAYVDGVFFCTGDSYTEVLNELQELNLND